MYFIALLLQLCFVWPKHDHTLQAILPEECGHPLAIRSRAAAIKRWNTSEYFTLKCVVRKNFSQWHHKQSFSRLHSPRRSNFTSVWLWLLGSNHLQWYCTTLFTHMSSMHNKLRKNTLVRKQKVTMLTFLFFISVILCLSDSSDSFESFYFFLFVTTKD